jgi:hypothetical protein
VKAQDVQDVLDLQAMFEPYGWGDPALIVALIDWKHKGTNGSAPQPKPTPAPEPEPPAPAKAPTPVKAKVARPKPVVDEEPDF